MFVLYTLNRDILYSVLILLQTDRTISPFPSSIPKYLDAERDCVMKFKLVICLGHKVINLDLTQWTAHSVGHVRNMS